MSFTKKIKPYVDWQLAQAKVAIQRGNATQSFLHLENAHVLGQLSTYHHTKVHFIMFCWAIRYRKPKQMFGQIFRILGALTKTGLGLVPTGNTGGTDVSPFKTMPVNPYFANIIKRAQSK